MEQSPSVLGKLKVTEVVEKFSAFYGTRKLIAVFGGTGY
jgi:hypothetical protein